MKNWLLIVFLTLVLGGFHVRPKWSSMTILSPDGLIDGIFVGESEAFYQALEQAMNRG